MERRLRSPKEEKSNKLDSLPSGQIIPFDRFPNFHKWVTQCRLQQSAARNCDDKNEGKNEKYPIKKGAKNFDTKDLDRDGSYNKNKNGERHLHKPKLEELSKMNVRRGKGAQNDKGNKANTYEDGNQSTDTAKASTKKDKLTNNDNIASMLRKRPHTANPLLQRMKTQSASSSPKHFSGVVENKSVILQPKARKENLCEKKLPVQNRAQTANVQNRPNTPKIHNRPYTPNEQKRIHTPNEQKRSHTPNEQKRSYTPNEQKRSNTPNEQKRSHTPNEQKRSHTPNEQKRPHTPNPQSKPNTPNILFKNQDYSSSRGDKKIQKIVEKVDGSCVFIKAAVAETRNEKLLRDNHANVHKRSHSAFRTLQRMKAFTDAIRTKRANKIGNETDDSDASRESAVAIDIQNNSVKDEKLEKGLKANIKSDISIKLNRPQTASGKLQNNSDSLNNFVDEMERSFLNKNYLSTSVEEQKKNNFLEVPKLENIISEKKNAIRAERPQSANNVLLQKARRYTESYRNFVDEMERCYPRYNFGEVTNVRDPVTDNLNSQKETEGKVNHQNKDDNKTETVVNTKRPLFSELNEKISLDNDWIFENQPKKAKSLSDLKDSFNILEDKINTSHTILREKIGQYVKVCVPDICGKRIIKSIEGKIDDLERIINEKLKIGYQSTDLGNHFSMFKNAPDVFNSLDKKELSEKLSSTTDASSSNKIISNAGLIKYMEEKIEAYEKKYSYNFCNEAFITNLQDKVDALQKCIPMILNVEKPKCQDAQCYTSDLFIESASTTNNETQFKKVNETEQESSEVWEVALEEFGNKKSSLCSSLDKTSYKSLENDLSKPQIVKQNCNPTKRQCDKPVTTVDDARRVLAQAQNLFHPQKVFRVQSTTAIENSKQKVDGGVNKNFSLLTTQKSTKMEEYKNFLRKYKIVKFDDINLNKAQMLPSSSKEENKSPFFKILNSNKAEGTTSSRNKEYEEMCAERHAEVIENLQKRIEHFKNSSRISELRTKIDEIKSSISRVTNSQKNSTLEMDSNNVNVICSVQNYLEESDSVMETSCEDLLKVSEDITNLDEEIKHCKTQLAFYQSINSSDSDAKTEMSSKLATVSERNSRCTFSPRFKYFHRTQPRPKSANAKYSKTSFGGITKIIKNLQHKMDQHEKFYQSCNEAAAALTTAKVASLERNNFNNETIRNNWGSNKLLSTTNVDAKESDLLSIRAIENLKVKVDSLTETCNVANIRELQNKLENIERASSFVEHADIIKTLQAKIEKLETALDNQTNLTRRQDSTETLYSCSSSRTFTNKSSESRMSRDSKNLFDEMPACTYCMAVTLDHKPNLINWDKS